MPTEIVGDFDGAGRRFAIIAGRFNELLTRNLVAGAVDCLARHRVSDADITVVWVPGAFDIPLVARRVAGTAKADAVVCLGAVIAGATSHHEHVGGGAAHGISRASLDADIPMTFGIITADSMEQALERAGAKQGNLGWNAATAALELISVLAKVALN